MNILCSKPSGPSFRKAALRAAERLGCTQSNVTARLRLLEASLDAPLFDQHGKRLVLNDAGRRLIPYCDRILRLVDEATQVVREAPVARSFRLGSMESGGHAAAGARRRVEGARRRSALRCRSAANRIWPMHRCAAGSTPRSPRARSCARVALRAGVRRRDGAGERDHGPRRQVLADHPVRLLAFHDGCPYRAVAEHWLKARGIAIESVASFGTFGAILGCVAAGMGVAILPKRITTEHVARKELRAHSFDDLDSVTTYLVTSEEAPELPSSIHCVRCSGGRRGAARR